MEVAEAKKELRRKMKALREELGEEARAQADARIAEKVLGHPAWGAAGAVFAYLSVGAEVDTRALIRAAWEQGKLVAIPRVVPGTRRMEWYAIDSFEGMEKSKLGVEEPAPDPSRLVIVPGGEGAAAVALVPGYSFDTRGFRLGYGGGFYDVFLGGFGGASLGLCRAAQYSLRPLPHDVHDLPVDEVIVA